MLGTIIANSMATTPRRSRRHLSIELRMRSAQLERLLTSMARAPIAALGSSLPRKVPSEGDGGLYQQERRSSDCRNE